MFSVGLQSTGVYNTIGSDLKTLPATNHITKDSAELDITVGGKEWDEKLIFYLGPDKKVVLIRHWSG